MRRTYAGWLRIAGSTAPASTTPRSGPTGASFTARPPMRPAPRTAPRTAMQRTQSPLCRPLPSPLEIEELRHPHEPHDAPADRRHVLAVQVGHELGVGQLVLLAPGDEADRAVGQRVAHPFRVGTVGQGEAEPVLGPEDVDRRALDGPG